jgi:hypothetical protein
MGGGSSTTKSMEQSNKTEFENASKQEAARLTPWAPVANDMLQVAAAGRQLYGQNPSGMGAMTQSALGGIASIADFQASRAEGMSGADVARNKIIQGLKDNTLQDRSNDDERPRPWPAHRHAPWCRALREAPTSVHRSQ